MNFKPSSQPSEPENGHCRDFAFFQWRKTDTLSLLLVALLLLGVLYPMAFLGRVPHDRDTLLFFYPLLSVFEQPQVGLWNPYQLAGGSLAADPQAALFYPPNWIFFLLPTTAGYLVSTIGHYWLAALGVYLLARFSRQTPGPALAAACVFVLGGYMASRLILRPLLLSAAWYPFIFLGFLYGHYRNKGLGFLLAGVFLALQLLTGMPHNAVYSAIALGVFTLYKLIVEFPHVKDWKYWLVYLARYAVVLGIAFFLASIMLLPVLELLPHTVRTQFGFKEATANSLPPSWTFDTLIGGVYQQVRNDWTFHESNAYLGAVALWLIVFAIPVYWKRGIFWFYGGLAFLGFLFAYGSYTPFFQLFYHIPLIGRFFDIPSRFLGLVAFALAMQAGYGFQALLSLEPSPGRKPLTWQAYPLIVLSIVIALVSLGLQIAVWHFSDGRLFQILAHPAARTEVAVWYATVNVTFFTILFSVFTLAYLSGWMRIRLFQTLILLILLGDLLHTRNQAEVPHIPPASFFEPPPPVLYLQHRADPSYRVMGFDVLKNVGGDIRYHRLRAILTPKLGLYYRLQDVAGYDPLILERYSVAVQQTVGLAQGETPLRVVAWQSPHTLLADLLRVGYISGEVWDRPVFDELIELLPGETRRLRVRTEKPCREIRFRSAMRGPLDLKQNTEVGRLTVRDATGESVEFPIRVGIETAHLLAEMSRTHRPAPPHRSWHAIINGRKVRVHNYVARLSFDRPLHPVEMEFTNTSEASIAIQGVALTEVGTGRFEKIFEHDSGRVYRNRTACPPVWRAAQVRLASSPDSILDILRRQRDEEEKPVNLHRTVFIEKPLPLEVAGHKGSVTEGIQIIEWKPEQQIIETDFPENSLLVFSEIDYPGWQVWIDGAPASFERVDYFLRGLVVPAGKHRIEAAYRPVSFQYGLAASGLSLGLVILLFIRYYKYDGL
jgi:hypothetical protein